MMESVWKLVLSPNEFFAHEQKDPALRDPVLMVTLTGVLYGLTAVVIAPIEAQQFSGDLLAYFYAGVAFSWFTTLLATHLIWIFYTGMFFLTGSVLFGVDGDFRTLLKLTGWGFLGQVVAGVAAAGARFFLVAQAQLSSQPLTMTYIQSHPLFQVASIVGMIAFLWSIYLWNFAVQYTFSLPITKSAVTVGVPVAVSVAIFYFTSLVPTFV